MKKRILIISITVLSLAFALEKAIDFGIQRNNNIKVSFAHQGKLKADIWVHGPCEPLFSIDPKLLERYLPYSVYNIAVRHTDFTDNYLQLLISLEKNPAPKMVLFYVTPESFDEQFNAFHAYRYLSFNSSEVDSVLKHSNKTLYWWKKIPLAKYAYHNQFKSWKAIQGWKHFLFSESTAYYDDGYQEHHNTDFTIEGQGYEIPGDFTFRNGIVATITEEGFFYQMYDAELPLAWSQKRAKALEQVITLCRANGIKIALYESPLFHDFAMKSPNRRVLLNQLDSLAKANQIPFWKFDILEFSKDQSNYVSPLILSRKGTALFTPFLSDSISTFLEK